MSLGESNYQKGDLSMKKILVLLGFLLSFFVFSTFCYAEELVSKKYPNLEFTILNWAKLVDLDSGNIFKSPDIVYTEATLTNEIKSLYPEMIEEAKENLLFFLEERVGKKLLLATARKEGQKMENEEEAIMNLLLAKTQNIKIDDSEVEQFFKENLSKVEGMQFDKVKDHIKTYLLNMKKRQAIRDYLQTFGKDKDLKVDKTWFDTHVKKLFNNPVDRARGSGKVTMVQFGADGCEPCELMRPFIKELSQKYNGKKNIVFVDVTKNRVLAIRYGVEMVPVQVFYDTKGKEVFRHPGFYTKEQIEKKLDEIEKGG